MKKKNKIDIGGKIESVIGSESDLICIRCGKERKIRMSAFCLKCKVELDPDYLERRRKYLKGGEKDDNKQTETTCRKTSCTLSTIMPLS